MSVTPKADETGATFRKWYSNMRRYAPSWARIHATCRTCRVPRRHCPCEMAASFALCGLPAPSTVRPVDNLLWNVRQPTRR